MTVRRTQPWHVAVNAVSLYVERKNLSFHSIHVERARRFAQPGREAGLVSLIHVSGISARPDSESKFIRSRATGEQVVREHFPGAHNLRPSVMFGPGDMFLNNLEVASRMPVVPLFGTGRMKLQPAWVEDVATAVATLVSRGAADSYLLEFGGGQTLSYRAALTAVCEQLGRKRLFIPFPMSGWKALTRLMSLLPDPPLTVDQLYLLADCLAPRGQK